MSFQNYEIFEIPKKKRSLWDLGEGGEDDPVNSIVKKLTGSQAADHFVSGIVHQVLQPELLNQPLYLMPGYWADKE